jgi:uncharacterized protein YhbP (UPF0306 family)
MNARMLVRDYLKDSRVMQLTTVSKNRPWACSVYFVADEKMNLYWLSWPSRRHSKEIAKNSNVAIAIVVKPEQPVIGIQAAGRAEQVNDSKVVGQVMKLYVEKYDSGKDFYNNFIAGKNQHVLYQFIPDDYVLFDEVNFPGKDKILLTINE